MVRSDCAKTSCRPAEPTEAWIPDQVLDCRGLLCPMPLLKTQQALRGLRQGQVLEVLTTDPQSQSDLCGWAQLAGHEVLPLPVEGGVYRFYLRRGPARGG